MQASLINQFIQNSSKYNNTFTPLGSGETFVGTGETHPAQNVLVYVDTDKMGDLYIELGIKDPNTGIIHWSTSLRYAIVPGRVKIPHNLVKGTRYFRVRFENTSEETQDYIRLISSFGDYQPLQTNLSGLLADSFDAIATRPSDFFTEAAESRREGVFAFRKFGFNPNVGTAPETISAVSDSAQNYVPLSASTTIEISSDQPTDVSGSTGAYKLLVTGVNGDGSVHVEEFILTGGTVTSTSVWSGINRVRVIEAGSSKTNDGNISIVDSTAGSLQAYLPAGTSVTQQLFFTIPIPYVGLIYGLEFNIVRLSGTAPRVTIIGYSETNGVISEFFRKVATVENRGSIELISDYSKSPIVFAAGTNWWFEANTNTDTVEITGAVQTLIFEDIESYVNVF